VFRLPDSRRRPTATECADLATAYVAGNTIRELAERFGFHRETVAAALVRAGIARRYHERRQVDLELADELRASGLTITEVAATLGIGRTTLVKARCVRGDDT
jgi:hypothetical protein